MGRDIKKLKNRIKSIDSTLHLTKAMGLVASTKIRGASLAMNKSKQYADAIGGVIDVLTQAKECEKSVYMTRREEGKECVVVIGGDRGLAGGYNSNIFKLSNEYTDAEIFAIGKRACERFGKKLILAEKFTYEQALEIAKNICDGFKEGKYKSVKFIFTKYVSMMTQNAETVAVLPLEKGKNKKSLSVIYEPDEKTVLENVLEEYMVAKLIEAVKESFLCEVVARRFAMDSAKKNADQMIESLQHEYNTARQGAITQEITEIVAGSGI